MMGRLNRRGASAGRTASTTEKRGASICDSSTVRAGTVHPGRQRSGLTLPVVFVLDSLAVILPLAAVATGR
jgi:hypothetical protein